MSFQSCRGIDGVPDGFFELAQRVYRDDPRWIPEEPEQIARLFSVENPWFDGREAIVATVPGAARAAGFFDPGATIANEPVAFFGYWESVGDPAADRDVMSHIASWSASRGARRLYGPVNFSTFGTYRLRVDTGDAGDPFPGEPYNPAEYPAYLERLGFIVAETYVSQMALPGAVEAKTAVRDRVIEQGYRIEPLTHECWMESRAGIHRCVDAIFGSNPGYTLPSQRLFETMCGVSFIARYCPDSSGIAYAPDGSLAGFLLTLPHYGAITVQRAASRRVPASRLSFHEHYPLLAAAGPVTGIAKTGGVLRQHRRAGIMDALVVEGSRRGEALYDDWIGALIRADNPSRRLGGGAHLRERQYALYSKPI